MANPSISIDDDLLEDFDRILDVKEMLGERENDKRSPVVKELIEEYVDENQEYLEKYEEFIQGNPNATAVTAD